ncbi:MAG TPA: CinA family protein [Iamia sp.]|nr:CinA family protein [Iamia sp.]
MLDPITDGRPSDSEVDDLASSVAETLRAQDRSLAVAESLTGGLLANAFARADGAAQWFRGGVVAYASEVKHDLLAVPSGPVVSEDAAVAMAEAAARLLHADVAIAVTGVGGPDPQDGQPPGTVWLAVTIGGETRSELHRFDGGPPDVCDQTVVAALRRVLATIG